LIVNSDTAFVAAEDAVSLEELDDSVSEPQPVRVIRRRSEAKTDRIRIRAGASMGEYGDLEIRESRSGFRGACPRGETDRLLI
jgi:hypothetical protein